jgi:hypothetical protein
MNSRCGAEAAGHVRGQIYFDSTFSTKMPLTPASYSPPREWKNSLFQLQILSPKYAEQDYEAVKGSAPNIRNVLGPTNSWPHSDISFDENLADLWRHEFEFAERIAFAYAILDPHGKHYLGCIYVKPIKSKIDNDHRKLHFQTQVFFWLSSLQSQIAAEDALARLKLWFAESWPFAKVAFPGREIDWSSWEAMAFEAVGTFAAEK